MTTDTSLSADSAGAAGSKATRFRSLLRSPALTFLMEAHDGLSAKIVEEAGFPGIWASGLTISAALGVRDSNEASWTQVLEVLEFMADATSIPILLDGDTGYGNFNNVRRLVRKLCQRGRGRRLHRGQALPQDQLLHRRAPAAGRHRRVLRQDQGRQGQRQPTPTSRSSRASRR